MRHLNECCQPKHFQFDPCIASGHMQSNACLCQIQHKPKCSARQLVASLTRKPTCCMQKPTAPHCPRCVDDTLNFCRTVLHLSTLSSGQTAAEDLATAVSALTNTSAVFGQSSGQSSGMPSSTESSSSRNRQTQEQVASNINPAALLVVFFNQVCRQDQSDLESLPSNVVACSPPDVSLDPDSAVQHARASFAKLYPDDAFGASAGSSPDADSDDEALDALSGVLQSLDTT